MKEEITLFKRGERVGVKVDRSSERQEKDQAVKVRNDREGNREDGMRSGNRLTKIKRKWGSFGR